jgi:hypothetical protein
MINDGNMNRQQYLGLEKECPGRARGKLAVWLKEK